MKRVNKIAVEDTGLKAVVPAILVLLLNGSWLQEKAPS